MYRIKNHFGDVLTNILYHGDVLTNFWGRWSFDYGTFWLGGVLTVIRLKSGTRNLCQHRMLPVSAYTPTIKVTSALCDCYSDIAVMAANDVKVKVGSRKSQVRTRCWQRLFNRLSFKLLEIRYRLQCFFLFVDISHGLQSLPPSPKRAERKGRRRPFREAGSGHKQWNTVSCVDTFSIISKFSAQNSKI